MSQGRRDSKSSSAAGHYSDPLVTRFGGAVSGNGGGIPPAPPSPKLGPEDWYDFQELTESERREVRAMSYADGVIR